MVLLNPGADELIECLNKARRARHLTMDDLADAIGMKRGTLYHRLSNGTLRLTDYLKLCEACGLEIMVRSGCG